MSLIAALGGKETFELGLAVVLDQVEPSRAEVGAA
jgi:hypothetical protein